MNLEMANGNAKSVHVCLMLAVNAMDQWIPHNATPSHHMSVPRFNFHFIKTRARLVVYIRA